MSREPKKAKLIDRNTFPVDVLIDTREQRPYPFSDIPADAKEGGGILKIRTQRVTLQQGDYSLEGFTDQVAIERKSLADLFQTIGQERDRFERELERLAGYRFAAVMVEGEWRDVFGVYRQELVQVRDQMLSLADGSNPQPLADLQAQAAWSRQLMEWVCMISAAMPGPPKYSQLDPKTISRSVIAWQQRYPVIHWQFMPDRVSAERFTFRMLQRFYADATTRTTTKGG